MSDPRWTVEAKGESAHLLLDRGVVCGAIYHPWDPQKIADALNDADTLTRARQRLKDIIDRLPDDPYEYGAYQEALDLLTGEDNW